MHPSAAHTQGPFLDGGTGEGTHSHADTATRDVLDDDEEGVLEVEVIDLKTFANSRSRARKDDHCACVEESSAPLSEEQSGV